MVSFYILDSLPCPSNILVSGNILAVDNKKESKREARDDAERICNAFLKLVEAYPAIVAEAFYGSFVQ